MENKKFQRIIFYMLFVFLIFAPAYALSAEQKQVFKAAKDKAIQQVRPNKPIKIKLQRKSNGEYTWDITGDNADEIIKADKRLRKLLQIE